MVLRYFEYRRRVGRRFRPLPDGDLTWHAVYVGPNMRGPVPVSALCQVLSGLTGRLYTDASYTLLPAPRQALTCLRCVALLAAPA